MSPHAQERIDAIVSVYQAGMSAKQIAEAVHEQRGINITRNAIIGLYRRHPDVLKGFPLLAQGVNLHRPEPKPRGPYNVKPRAPKQQEKPETRERIDAIISCYRPGMSASQLAAALGRRGFDMTRSAVLGMYHRHPEDLKKCPIRKSYHAIHKQRKKTGAAPSNVVPFVLPESMFTYVPTHPTKRLLDLEAHECRWPMNGTGAETQFCAQHAEGSYCEHHRRMSIGQGTRSERMAVRAARRLA